MLFWGERKTKMLTPNLTKLIMFLSFFCFYLVLLIVLGWPKSSFGFFCKMLWKNLNELFGQPRRLLFKSIYSLTSTSMGRSMLPCSGDVGLGRVTYFGLMGCEVHFLMPLFCSATWFTLFLFWLREVACGILVSWPGIKPLTPSVAAWSLTHWTASEVPDLLWQWDVMMWTEA